MYIGNLNRYFAVSFLTYPNRCMLPLESRGCFFNLFILSLTLCNLHGLHDKYLLNKWIPIIFLHWRVKCNDQQSQQRVLTLLLLLGIGDIAEKSVEMAQEESIFHLGLIFMECLLCPKVLIDTYLTWFFHQLIRWSLFCHCRHKV